MIDSAWQKMPKIGCLPKINFTFAEITVAMCEVAFSPLNQTA